MPTQLITKTKIWIDQHLTSANTLALTAELIGDAIADSFAKVFGKPALEIGAVSVSVADTSVNISGNAALGGAAAISITVEIKDVIEKYHIAVLFPEMQVPDNLGQNLSALWKRFETPPFFADFKIVGIEFPSIQNSVSIIAEQGDSLRLAGDKIIIGPAARIKFQVSNLSQTSIDIHAEFSAPVAIGSFKFRLVGELSTDDAVDSNLAILPIAPAGYPSLGDLMKVLLGAGVQIPSGLSIADLQLGNFFQKDAFTLSVRFKEKWSLALGPAGVTVRDIAITVIWTGSKLTASLQGTATIAGFDVKIDSNLQEQLMLRGKLPKSNLSSLIRSIAGPVLSLPSGFPEIELPEADFFIPSLADPFSFLLKTQAGDYGIVWLLIAQIDGTWQAAVAFELADDWKFSRLSNLLAPLDRLRIENSKLTLATFSKPELSFPVIDGAALQLALSKGVSLNTDLMLHGFGLDFISVLTKKDRLPLLLTVGDSLSKTEVQARLANSIVLLPGVIVFEQLFLKITPEPFVIALEAIADVTILRQKLPKFSVSAGIEEGKTEIELKTIEPWENPLGIKGLTINKVALQIKASPAPQYGILGEIAVSDDKVIMMAAQFTGAAPSMIAGELKGTLSLQEVVRKLVGLSLHDILDISITDFKVRAVADPLGVTIGGVTFEPGLALQGTIGFFGLKAFTKVVVEPDKGVYAHAALSDKIDLGGVLIISNAAGDGPAFFTLDTRQSPFLVVSGKISLLGLSQSVDAVVDTSGIQVAIKGDFGPAHYEWACRVKSLNQFEASGSLKFALNGSIGPIRLAPGTPSLGTIRIDTGFQGSASISVKNNQFASSIQGGFYFRGLKLDIPRIELDVAPSSLEKLPDIIWKQIQDNAKDIFADFLNDADKWLLALRDGLVEGVEHVARVLKDQFNRTAEQIGKDIRDTLKMGSVAAASALKELENNAVVIANILKNLGDPRDTIEGALKGVGFAQDEIDRAVANAFNIHIDIHIDSYAIPPVSLHGDLDLIPHIDTHGDFKAIPPVSLHGDFKAIPAVRTHSDFNAIPAVRTHSDFNAIPAVRTHGDANIPPHDDFHTDFRKFGIHGDIHGDHWMHVDIHGDRPGQAHVDIHTDTPGQAHVDIHGDTPGQAHVDWHTDTPGQAHVDIHGDTPGQAHGDWHTDTPPQGHVDFHQDAP